MTKDEAAVLRRGLDQLAGLLGDVPRDAMGRPTPCTEWTVQELVDHVVEAPAKFARMVRGESVDWAAATPAAGDDPAAAFRAHADDLLRSSESAAEGAPPVSWQCAEIAVHTWDLATALGRSTADLDAEVAECGLGFMQASLTDDNRAPAFGAEQPAPAGADAYEQIAAFAGRTV